MLVVADDNLGLAQLGRFRWAARHLCVFVCVRALECVYARVCILVLVVADGSLGL